jgi:hypothetical protein
VLHRTYKLVSLFADVGGYRIAEVASAPRKVCQPLIPQ